MSEKMDPGGGVHDWRRNGRAPGSGCLPVGHEHAPASPFKLSLHGEGRETEIPDLLWDITAVRLRSTITMRK
jgi:hypothetical protein